MNVNMSSLFAPTTTLAQERNVSQAVSHVHWALALPNSAGTGPLVDPHLVFLCGHSAGGAVALEASVALRKEGVHVKGLCLLDGVPWPRTERVASSELFGFGGPLRILSLRSVPGAWNLKGKIKGTLDTAWAERKGPVEGQQQQQQSYVDVFIKESGHGDPINPQKRGFIVNLLGLLGPPRCAAIYADLLNTLAAVRGELGQPAMVELLNKLGSEKLVEFTQYS
jgi:pimeloyl-ACP methyl ester carboxylesterase